MKKVAATIFFALSAMTIYLSFSPSIPSMPTISTDKRESGETCTLSRVIDGDTIRVDCSGQTLSVRLLRINTPEKHSRGFLEAKKRLEALLGKGRVQLVNEIPNRVETDRFGRRLSYVFKNGHNANIEMVRSGWSKYWTKYGFGRFRAAFESAEKSAQSYKAGLWSE